MRNGSVVSTPSLLMRHRNAVAQARLPSKFSAGLRLHWSQATRRSTTQRRELTSKPTWSGLLRTIWIAMPVALATRGPAQAVSAEADVMNGAHRFEALSSEMAPRRSCISAEWTCNVGGRPSMSTIAQRSRPLIFLPASQPRGSPALAIVTLWLPITAAPRLASRPLLLTIQDDQVVIDRPPGTRVAPGCRPTAKSDSRSLIGKSRMRRRERVTRPRSAPRRSGAAIDSDMPLAANNALACIIPFRRSSGCLDRLAVDYRGRDAGVPPACSRCSITSTSRMVWNRKRRAGSRKQPQTVRQ